MKPAEPHQPCDLCGAKPGQPCKIGMQRVTIRTGWRDINATDEARIVMRECVPMKQADSKPLAKT